MIDVTAETLCARRWLASRKQAVIRDPDGNVLGYFTPRDTPWNAP